MKQIIYILFLLVTFCACDEEVIAPYKGDCGMYFDVKQASLDTMFVTWGLKDSKIKEQTVSLTVRLFGDVATYDRKFSIDIISDENDSLRSVEGIDYVKFPTEYVIPANEAETKIAVKVLRTDVLMKQARRFTIQLKETPELQFLYSRTQYIDSVTSRMVDTQRVIYMDEAFPEPLWWYRYGRSIFGTWSATKSKVICDVMGIDREIWVGNLVEPLTIGYIKFVGKYMHRWLQENPTKDEDDEWMQMGPDSQV
jgi:lipoprotein